MMDDTSAEYRARRYRVLAEDARWSAKQSTGEKRAAFNRTAAQWERLQKEAEAQIEVHVKPPAVQQPVSRGFWNWLIGVDTIAHWWRAA
jgi:hypothetical protein